MCDQCCILDDENHRLNFCPKWQENNLFASNEKVDFSSVFADDLNTVRQVTVHIEKIWDTRNSNGKMRD